MSRSYRFGEFRVNPASRQLWRGERLVVLPPLVFDCLTYLIEHHDRAVGRDELVAAVWGKAEINDTLLRQTILRIRRELGDEAKEQSVLRTIPRFGYHWIAALESDELPAATLSSSSVPLQAPAAAQPVMPSDSPAPGRSAPDTPEGGIASADSATASAMDVPARQSPRLAWVAVIFAALLVGAAWWLLHRQRAATAPDEASIAHVGAPVSAVLPAVIEPASSEWSWMRFGVMDATAARLRSAGLPSVPSENIVAFLAAPEGHRSGDIRATLVADLLVTPRVQQVAGEWRIELTADDGAGRHYAVEAQATDAMTAARTAADQLLTALGRSPVESDNEHADSALVRRIDAAVLADDPETARVLIAQASPGEQQSPEVRLRLAKIDYRGGRLDAARERLVAMLDEAPASTAPVLRASILNGLGAVALTREQSEQAARYFAEAVPLLESHNEPEQLGQAYLGRAAAATDQGRFDSAAADFGRARIAYRQANNNLALIRVATDEGIADYDQRRPGLALPQFDAAARGFQQWGALNEAIVAYIYQIACHLALLDSRAAMQSADAADTLAQRIDNRKTLDQLRLARARALLATGRLAEARAVLLGLRGMAGTEAETVASAGAVLAQLELEVGNATAADGLAERAVSVLSTPNFVNTRGHAWFTQVRAELKTDPGKAAATLAAFEEWVGRIADPRAQLFARLTRAEQARRTGAADWRRAFADASDLAARDGIPYEIAAVARSYADALLAAGDLEAAAVEVGRVSRWSDTDFDCAVLEARLYAATGREQARQTAVARARALAGERKIPEDALSASISAGDKH